MYYILKETSHLGHFAKHSVTNDPIPDLKEAKRVARSHIEGDKEIEIVEVIMKVKAKAVFKSLKGEETDGD